MKLLFDQNLSYKLTTRLSGLFPGSQPVRQLNLDTAGDRRIWEYAKSNEFTIVTHDSDFADLSAVLGTPPKVIWLRCGNQATDVIESLLRRSAGDIIAFGDDPNTGCLEVY